MVDRYKPLFEMSYRLQDYENKIITPPMLKIFVHFIKYKLTDKIFANKIDTKIYPHCIRYKEYWTKEIGQTFLLLFRELSTTSIKSKTGSKERAYLSSLENTIALLSTEGHAIQAMRDATNKNKNSEEIRISINKFFFKYNVRDSDFISKVYSFFEDIKPIKNVVALNERQLQIKLLSLFTVIDTIHE